MSPLRTLLQRQTGLMLTEADLARAVYERLQARGLAAGTTYAPLPGTPEFDALLDLLVVPESWLLRDPAVFAHALQAVQRRLLERPGVQVRVLSLPCAGGEEPYSLAMQLADAGIGPAQCRIDAIDISRAAIDRARQGRYTNNAFRGPDPDRIAALRARWFARDGAWYAIAPALREYVCFSQGNLFALPDHVVARRYDLVFCRNLLIYFDADACARAAGRLLTLLVDDGQLLSGYAEAPALCAHGFAPAAPRTPFALAKAVPLPARRAPSAPRLFPTVARRPAPAPAPAPHATALLDQARRAADAGRLVDARIACDALLRTDPACAEAHYLCGLLAECARDDAAARRDWQRCLYLDPDHYEALCGLALLHERHGDTALAAGMRRRAARVFARRATVNGSMRT